MPLYEYECSIHKTIEVQQSINDPPLTECPLCREEKDIATPIKRIISLCSFHLLGSGWARDGYKG
jgi:putative FmdB family regulatory protein